MTSFEEIEWSEIGREAELLEDPQYRADRVRVLGYLELCRRRRVDACDELRRMVEALIRARDAAEKAKSAAHAALDDEETMMSIAARNDPDEFSRIAIALEQVEG